MKSFKFFYLTLSALPWAWLIALLSILFTGWAMLGVVPTYGNPRDPHSLGIDYLSMIAVVFSIMNMFNLAAWPIVTGMIIGLGNGEFSVKRHCLIFATGITSLLVFRFAFTNYFAWVVD